MYCASTSTYPENLGSGGLLPAELGGRVCLFFCPSLYDARHRKPRLCVYALNLGGTGISPPDKRPPRTVLVFVLVSVFVIVLVPPAPDTQQAATYSIAAVAGN